ncbi:hypothetical protein [Antrihabitans cavernicola]|uniref:Uncharacterized protein n=1 Tax=Antrihabitans cavernicola TaxID=2495913 RepID=A0A5A7SDU0_9NOCA|nr:hypothetical protein [Spelaeibacter cavernicola]KAA0022763.1 hypothetical protein FOY51_13905 [Spelaeibacter cavernicola]
MDALLDSGARGLWYFDEFLPRAARIADVNTDPEQLRARYDQQRGLDLAALAADVETLGRSLAIASEQWSEQQARVRSLEPAWSGLGGDAARKSLHDNVDRDRQHQDGIASAHDAMGESVRSLRSVIDDKARAVGSYSPEVDGKTGVDIDKIIDGAQFRIDDLSDIFPDLAGLPTPEQVAQRCATWLAEVFVPHVQEHLTHFEEMCTAADRAVRDVYSQLTGSMAAVGDQPAPNPGTTAPHDASPQFDLDKVGHLVDGVAKVATLLGNAVVGAASDAVDGLLERLQPLVEDQPAPDTDQAAVQQQSDFDVNGHHLRIEQQPDSDLTLQVGDSAGGVRSFELAVGSDGTPVIDGIDATPEAVDPEPAAPALEPAPAPHELADSTCEQVQPSTPPDDEPPADLQPDAGMATPALRSAPKSNRSGDGVLAEAGPDETDPPETGAELAEAGPL